MTYTTEQIERHLAIRAANVGEDGADVQIVRQLLAERDAAIAALPDMVRPLPWYQTNSTTGWRADGMTYIHENDVQGYEGWDAYRAQSARIAELEAENAILRTEKHADAEAIGALLSALTEIRDWRKSCHDHDKDMGHDPREFDVEDLKMVEFRASAAIKGVTNV